MKTLMNVLRLSVVIVGLCGITDAEDIVTDGLVSYWTFDREHIIGNTVKDAQGENNAIIVGNPTIVNGHLKDGLQFDGIDDFVNLTTLGDFGAKLDSSTFEVWIKTGYKATWTTLFKVRDHGCGIDSGGMGWGIDLNRTFKHREPLNLLIWLKANPNRKPDDILTSGKDFVMTFSGSHKLNAIGCDATRSLHEFPISDGEWHHLVYTIKQPYVDENGKEWRESELFIDGTINRTTKVSPIHPNKYVPFSEPIYLGAGNNLGKAEGFFNGIIDEVRIYNRPLTEAEIMHNYQSTIGLVVEHIDKLPTVWGALKKR